MARVRVRHDRDEFTARHLVDVRARRTRREGPLGDTHARADVRGDELRERCRLPRHDRRDRACAVRGRRTRAVERQAGRRHRRRVLGRRGIPLRWPWILVFRAARHAEQRPRGLRGPARPLRPLGGDLEHQPPVFPGCDVARTAALDSVRQPIRQDDRSHQHRWRQGAGEAHERMRIHAAGDRRGNGRHQGHGRARPSGHEPYAAL